MKAVLYVKKEKPYLRDKHNVYGDYHCFPKQVIAAHYLNGKIIAECDYEVEDIVYKHIHERDQFGILNNGAWYEYKGLNVTHYECDLASRSGFEDDSSLFDYLFDYLVSKDGKAINIKNLSVFDKPRELDEYYSEYYVKGIGFTEVKLKPASQSMRYCYNVCNHKYILISITPQEACNILNHKQDVLIRRTVLKEMK